MVNSTIIPVALSLSDSIKSIGDYAGFAAIIGLAVLALLYFSQAREVKRLREWAGRAPERDAEEAARVSEQAQVRTSAAVPGVGLKQPTGTPATPAAGTVRDVKPVGVAATPAAGAAAATAAAGTEGTEATKKPEGDQPAVTSAPAAQQTAAAKTTVQSSPQNAAIKAQPASAEKGAPGVGGEQSAAPPDQTQIARPTPPADKSSQEEEAKRPAQVAKPAATPQPDSDQTTVTTSKSPSPAATPQPRSPARKPSAPAQRPAAATPLRRTTPSAKPTDRATAQRSPQRRAQASKEKGGLPKPVVVIGSLVTIALIIFIFVQLTGDSTPQKPNQTTPVGQNSGGGSSQRASQPLARGRITVSVLNGTTVPGLAAQVADQVQGAGFKRGTVTNAADQQLASTTVFYSSGNSRAAKEVAKILKTGSPKSIDPGTQSIAGANADVVVVVGSDRTQ